MTANPIAASVSLPPAQWMALWLPRLPTDRLRRLGSAPADGSPFALYAKIGNAFELTSVDATAAALGLKPGMPLADARAMQPGLATRAAEDAADAALLDRIAGWCERYTPIVAVDLPHGLFLDVTGCPHLFGGPEALRAEVVQRLKAQGLGARAAIAPTPGAAWALARHGVPGVVDPGKVLAALAPLPVAALRLSAAAAALLKRLGLTRIGQLVHAPRQPFAARAGQDAMRRLDQALGRAPEALSPRHPPPRLFALRRLVEPIQALDAMLAVAEVLCGELSARLDARGLGAMKLRLVLFGVDDRVRAIDFGFSRAERDPTPMLRVIRERLSTTPEALDAEFGFEAVRLDALETAAPLPQPTDLAPASARNPEAEARVLDRLAARLGEDRVSRLARRPVHAPERASALLPATGAPPLPAGAHAPEDGVMRRPLRLFPHAKPIDVIASVPDGPPMRFRWRRVLHEVARAEGPERISPHWLRAPDSRARDYYRVEDRAGRRFWMYREGLYEGADPPRWFLHGLFA